MNRVRDEFFSCACLTGNENRRIGWRNLGDAREHSLQSGRGSNDLFEHRGPVDFFAEGDVFLLQPFLSPLPVFDISTRNVPTQDLSVVVAQPSCNEPETNDNFHRLRVIAIPAGQQNRWTEHRQNTQVPAPGRLDE